MTSNLLEQSRGHMWIQDPRRYSNQYDMMTSLQRPQHYQQHGRRHNHTQKYMTPHYSGARMYSNGTEMTDKNLNHHKKLPELCSVHVSFLTFYKKILLS